MRGYMNKKAIPAVLKTVKPKDYARNLKVSAAHDRVGDYPEPKKTGILVRGCGAATKGKMARGTMG